MVKIFTDGACQGRERKGGWAYVVIKNDKIIEQKSGFMCATTCNRMELFAAIQALKSLGNCVYDRIVIYSDSQYLVKSMTRNWKKNKNQDLWEYLLEVSSGKNIEWLWVKGHSGNKFNEICDSLANKQASKKSFRPTSCFGLGCPQSAGD